ncbi:hypothetical protein PYCC9005_003917 [Savitreella phatthalungensis]
MQPQTSTLKYSRIPSSEFNFYTRTWTPPAGTPTLATVVFQHGFAEHCDRYAHVFEACANRGIEVFAFDGRGFGQSADDSTAGVNGGWAQQINDLDRWVSEKRRSDVPQFLWGHSMGGGLVIKYGLDGPHRDNLKGIVVSAPLLEQHDSAKPFWAVLKLGTLASKLLPDQIIPVAVPVRDCTRDPEAIALGEKDVLLRQKGSLKGISDMLLGGKSLMEPSAARRFDKPVLLVHGTGDVVCSHTASAKWFSQISSTDKTHKQYDGYFHEPHNDLGRDVPINDCIDWILSRAKPSQPASKL